MPEKAPFFSVVIPSKDRAELLFNCLSSLERQSIPPNEFEVIVVDDGSRKPLHESLASFSPRFSLAFLRQENKGPAAARNAGAAAAKGKILAFIDDDCTADSEWLSSAKKIFLKEKVDIVEGATKIASPEKVCAISFQCENLSGGNFLTCNIFYSKPCFDSLGGFDPVFSSPMCEDTDLAWRAKEKKFIIKFSPGSLVFHSVIPSNAFSFLSKRLNLKTSYWNVLLAAKHPLVYAKERAFLGLFNPVLVPNYPFYFSLAFFLFFPYPFFLRALVLLAFYSLSVFLNTRLKQGASMKRVFFHPFSLASSFFVVWLVAFAELFFTFLAAIKFRRVLF
ncbi:MAG: glycosyltransferase [Candidatus Diapherotrites archaeon]